MKTLKVLIATALLSASGLAHSNLIVNGGFEDHTITSGWTYGPDASGGWEGDNLEIWATGFLNVVSYEGMRHAELNAHPHHQDVWSIYQSFDTVVGQLYEVSFAYRARRNDSEKFRFEIIDGTSLIDEVMHEHHTNDWSVFNDTFIGTGNPTKLKFTSIYPYAGTVGNFIDDVSVTSVPAPSVLALMCGGIVGFGLSRIRARTRS